MTRTDTPDFSLIIPCYNEEEVIGYTIPRIVKAFDASGHRLEIMACDNGSSDRTPSILESFVRQGFPVVTHRVSPNVGYGNGVLRSIPHCSAPWIGIIPADGQVDAEDVVRLYETVCRSDGHVVAKVRRRFRLDGPRRAVISFLYNCFVKSLWPRLGSFDVNGSPKVIHRDVLDAMKLESKDWLLDAEMIIKAYYMGIRVLEMNVFARMRERGSSHVRAAACWEFLKRLIGFRFGKSLTEWRRGFAESDGLPESSLMPGVTDPIPID